jgi:hypothetical protein
VGLRTLLQSSQTYRIDLQQLHSCMVSAKRLWSALDWEVSETGDIISKCAQVELRMEPSLSRCLEQHPQSSSPPIFVGLSSIGWFVLNSFFLQVCFFACSMGFMKNSEGMLKVLKAVLEATNNRAILLTASYPPLDLAIITTFEHEITQHLLPQVNSKL